MPEPTTDNSIDAYFAQHGIHHVKKAGSMLRPLHVPGQDAVPNFDAMARQPYEPQAHAIAAGVAMLDANKSGFLAAECGSGKTLIGQLIVHSHASRSRRRGGKRGHYRALVLCPDHLIKNWVHELKATIPGVKVTTFDDRNLGCKALVPEFEALYVKLRGNGKWKKPTGPEWYILGRDQAKRMPEALNVGETKMSFTGKYVGHMSMKRVLIKEAKGKKHYVCPKCGATVIDKVGGPVNVARSDKLLACTYKYAVEIPEPGKREQGRDVRQIPGDDGQKLKAGRVLLADGKRWRITECGERLWQYTKKPYRWAPSRFIHSKMKHCFTYLVCDEVHEQKSREAAQANAFGALTASCRYTLALTGTLIGGYANHVYPLLWRMCGRSLQEEGFTWKTEMEFVRRYGRIETTVTKTQDEGGSSRSRRSSSMRKEQERKSERPAPGIMPALFGRHLIDKAIFLGLEDMSSALPVFDEYVGGPDTENDPNWQDCRLACEDAQGAAYKVVEQILVNECRTLLQKGNMKLLGAMLQTTLGYTDHCWEWGPVGYCENDHFITVVTPEQLPTNIIYPKEQALIDLCRREVRHGNQVWIYCQMTNKRDVQDRLQGLLTQAGFRVGVLRSQAVKPRQRLDWLEKNGRKVDVMISHPDLVKTGMNFFSREKGAHNFNVIAYYQTGYNVFTMIQASRRAWRLSQEKDCRVYYFHYAGTMQQRAMQLVARKLSAAQQLDGNLSVDGLCSMADDASSALALARSLSQSIDESDLQRNWVKIGTDSLRRQPLDRLDNLPMKAQLLAATILDHEPDATRTSLADEFEDIFSISDADLELLASL